MFSWNGHQYLIIGWSGYFRTKTAGSGELFDAIAAGENVYDGLGVPMVCDYKDGRKLIAGWLHSIGWGSVILHRELLQEADGKLGMKWVPEMTPETKPGNLLAGIDLTCEDAELDPEKSYLITMNIDPAADQRVGIVFENEEGKACELQLDFEKKRVQINDASGDRLADAIPALYEMADQTKGSIWNLENIPQRSINFCLPDVLGMEQEFTLRILCRYSKKMDSTVIDAEIAGRRTLVSGRTRLFPSRLRVLREKGEAVVAAVMEELKIPVM